MSFLGKRSFDVDSQGLFLSQEPMSQRSRYAYSQNSQSSQGVVAKRRLLKKRQAATGLSRKIKSVMQRVAETKCLQYSGSLAVRSLQVGITQAQFDADCMCITPQGGTVTFSSGYQILGNGVGQDQRIGDKVRIKGQYIDFVIAPKPYDGTTNVVPAPCIVQVFVLKVKQQSSSGLGVGQVISGATAKLFENQTNADSGLTGSIVDLLRKVDRDNYQVIARKTYKIGYAGNLNTSNQLSTLPNNDFSAYAMDRIKIPSYDWKVNRLETYEGYNTYMFVSAVRADNVSLPTTQIPVSFDFNIATYFTDV